jgi:hypothetical protein
MDARCSLHHRMAASRGGERYRCCAVACSLYQHTVHSIPAAADSLSLCCAGGADTLQWAQAGTGEVRLSPAGDAVRASYEAVEGHAATQNVWM